MEKLKEWTFENAQVASGFDSHVREQLPWYELVTGAVAHIARHFIPKGGLVYDIGASTGNIGRALEETLKARKAQLIGIEASAEMCAKYDAPGELVQIDALDYRFQPYDLAICYLVLMFMPVEKRPAFIASLKSLIKPGGALLIVDKCEASSGYEATVFWRLTLAGKVAAGADARNIIAKELSLGGVQRPLDPAMLGDDATLWFRFGDFAGWLITK
ncbi:MAG: class I SAM-dependent methyltransferase [Alphaproteobacteria bacterium]|nr:class I SAM-dependent methyltransferase [Alphaproteobacteria bacterium]